jgi:hypothetical protein
VVYVEIMLIARPHTSTQVQLGPRENERERKSHAGAKFVSKRTSDASQSLNLTLIFSSTAHKQQQQMCMHGSAII